jgi:hypothetical protein
VAHACTPGAAPGSSKEARVSTPSFAPRPAPAAPARDPAAGWFRIALQRIRDDYAEMPGLCVTLDQAARLWHVDRHDCEALLQALIDVGFLRRSPRGFVRA